MKIIFLFIYTLLACLILIACENNHGNQKDHKAKDEHAMDNHHDANQESGHDEAKQGAHGGRLLMEGEFSVELAIFETGTPPEMRAWVKNKDQTISPEDVILHVWLQRLGAEKELIHFYPNNGYLRGDTTIYEPHSFSVVVKAQYQNNTYQWSYDSIEGRTKISADLAKSFNFETSIAGSAIIQETINVYGQIVANPENVRNISARFDGLIRNVNTSTGSIVEKGQTLATIESNESLNTYSIKTPISGVVTQRYANPGEQTNGRILFTIINTSTVWAHLDIFPKDRASIQPGNKVVVTTMANGERYTGDISNIKIVSENNQSIIARVILNNQSNRLTPGIYVNATISVAKHEALIAVKRSGLQSFRDFSVVYAQIGDQYEVRMLELGRSNKEWIEVLSGIKAGTRYVSKNSYLVKADIEKAGATHDH